MVIIKNRSLKRLALKVTIIKIYTHYNVKLLVIMLEVYKKHGFTRPGKFKALFDKFDIFSIGKLMSYIAFYNQVLTTTFSNLMAS